MRYYIGGVCFRRPPWGSLHQCAEPSPLLGRYDGLKAPCMRITPLPFGQLREWAYMTINEYSDPHVARVRVRRWIELPRWLQRK